MPLQWRNQIWQSLEEGAGKRCSECGHEGQNYTLDVVTCLSRYKSTPMLCLLVPLNAARVEFGRVLKLSHKMPSSDLFVVPFLSLFCSFFLYTRYSPFYVLCGLFSSVTCFIHPPPPPLSLSLSQSDFTHSFSHSLILLSLLV